MARKECYLYVQTIPLLLRLNLSDLFESGSSAEFEIAYDYSASDGRVPIGMACMVVGSKIYMVGGEKAQNDSMLSYPVDPDDEENYWFNKDDVYVFDHTKPESEDRLVPVRDGAVVGKLNSPKTRPIVFSFEGKFYVLSSIPYQGGSDPEFPFEVFDPTLPIPSWKVLPHLPDPVREYFAWGHKLLVLPEFSIFDAKDEKWDRDRGWDFAKQFAFKRAPFPIGASVEFKGVVFAVSNDINALVAYDLDASGHLKAHWVLDELSEVFEGPPSLYLGQGFLTDLGGGRMCVLFSGDSDDMNPNWIVRVEVFRVNITTVGDRPNRPVVHREILRSFNIQPWVNYSPVIDSVFICENPKKRAEHVVEYVKGDSKKPRTTLSE